MANPIRRALKAAATRLGLRKGPDSIQPPPPPRPSGTSGGR